jgi:predicted 2-oxoglutarate/Fe(II)-dependent dioxygenase YbiX
MFVDVLPGKEASPSHPFSGFVLNINVITRCHRDVKDHRVCLVLVIGDHVGGELCLQELGLVVRLRNGDIVVFPSGKITHFNLHYQGVRASIVLHSDNAGQSWVDNRNHWMGHDYMY